MAQPWSTFMDELKRMQEGRQVQTGRYDAALTPGALSAALSTRYESEERRSARAEDVSNRDRAFALAENAQAFNQAEAEKSRDAASRAGLTSAATSLGGAYLMSNSTLLGDAAKAGYNYVAGAAPTAIGAAEAGTALYSGAANAAIGGVESGLAGGAAMGGGYAGGASIGSTGALELGGTYGSMGGSTAATGSGAAGGAGWGIAGPAVIAGVASALRGKHGETDKAIEDRSNFGAFMSAPGSIAAVGPGALAMKAVFGKDSAIGKTVNWFQEAENNVVGKSLEKAFKGDIVGAVEQIFSGITDTVKKIFGGW